MVFTLPKDPRQSPEESASALSSYFQDKGKKAPSYTYSAPSDSGTGSAPSAPTTAPQAPTGSTKGGSGFVNFGSYFGGNNPAIQRESQKAAMGAKDFESLNVMRGQGGNVGQGTEAPTFNQMLMGGTQRRAAEQEGQQRFKQLGERLSTGITDPMQGQKIAALQAEEARRKKAAQDDYDARMEAFRQGEGYAY